MDSSVRRFGGRKPIIDRPIVLDTRFFIPYKYFQLVWEAAKDFQKYSISRSGLDSHRLVSLFNRAVEFGVGITRDKSDKEDKGDIVAIWYKGFGALGDNHYRFFQLISKYVQAGSYINLVKSDRPNYTQQCVDSGKALEENITYSQWFFNGDCMVEKEGTVVFK